MLTTFHASGQLDTLYVLEVKTISGSQLRNHGEIRQEVGKGASE